MKRILIFMLTLGIMAVSIFNDIAPASAAGWSAKDVQSAVGNHRVSSGVDVQREDTGMSQAAQAWAEKLASSDAPASQDPSKAGYRAGSQLVGSHSAGDVNAVITSWKTGANNILVDASYGLIGTGVAISASGKVYVVANFAPLPVVAPAPVPVKVPAPAPVEAVPEPAPVRAPVVVPDPEPVQEATSPNPKPSSSPSPSKASAPVSEPTKTPKAVPSTTPTPVPTQAVTPTPEPSQEVLPTVTNETSSGDKKQLREGLVMTSILAGLVALLAGSSLMLIRERSQSDEHDDYDSDGSDESSDDDDGFLQAITARKATKSPDTSLSLPKLP